MTSIDGKEMLSFRFFTFFDVVLLARQSRLHSERFQPTGSCFMLMETTTLTSWDWKCEAEKSALHLTAEVARDRE